MLPDPNGQIMIFEKAGSLKWLGKERTVKMAKLITPWKKDAQENAYNSFI